jgi:hypothetical protein
MVQKLIRLCKRYRYCQDYYCYFVDCVGALLLVQPIIQFTNVDACKVSKISFIKEELTSL